MHMRGCVCVGGKFLKEWQVIDQIIEQIFFQFIFNLLQMILNSRNNQLIGFQNLMNGYEGMCMSGGKFLKEWQVKDKIIAVNFFPIHIQPFMNDLNSRNKNS